MHNAHHLEIQHDSWVSCWNTCKKLACSTSPLFKGWTKKNKIAHRFHN